MIGRRWLWVLLPLALGAVLGAVFVLGWLPNVSLYLRINIAALAQICGAGIALLLAVGFGLQFRYHSRLQKRIAEIELHSAEDRRRFLQRLDHELKNPLTAIQAGLANLGELQEPKALESVKAQTLRLSRLAADLRKLAELEMRPIEKSDVSLREILETVVEMARESSVDRNLHIPLTLPQAPWPLPHVSGDEDLLLLAVHNLLDNAIKFAQSGDTIEVRAFEDGTTVVVEVADTGPGIPEEELPHVWQELYRGQGARGVPGSGLGLALVRAIVDRHDGQVSLRSRTQQGTVVSLRLPARIPGNP